MNYINNILNYINIPKIIEVPKSIIYGSNLHTVLNGTQLDKMSNELKKMNYDLDNKLIDETDLMIKEIKLEESQKQEREQEREREREEEQEQEQERYSLNYDDLLLRDEVLMNEYLIEERNKDLLNITQMSQDINYIMKELSNVIHSQEDNIYKISKNVGSSYYNSQKGIEEIKKNEYFSII